MVTRSSRRYTPPKSRWRLQMWPRDNVALRKVAPPVVNFDGYLAHLAGRLRETMIANNGLGLAAPQVGLNLALIVVDANNGCATPPPTPICNPRIVELEHEDLGWEGCLSIPNVFVEVPRAKRCVVAGQNLNGHEFTRELIGQAAVCVQHEVDHLQGVLMVDLLNESQHKSLTNLMREFDGYSPVAVRLERAGGVHLG